MTLTCIRDLEHKINRLLSFAVEHCPSSDDLTFAIRYYSPKLHKKVAICWGFQRNPRLKNNVPFDGYESRLLRFRQHLRPEFDTSHCTLWMEHGEIEAKIYTVPRHSCCVHDES